VKRIMVLLGFGSFLLLLFSTSSFADFPVSIQDGDQGRAGPMVAWHNNLKSGWREAKRRGVPMVIFITSDNCVYCDAMKQNTWCDKQVQRRLAGKFVAIRLNTLRNRETLSRIQVQTYPTTLLGSPNGKVIGHRVGYQPPAELQSFLAEAEPQQAQAKRDPLAIH